MPTNIAVKDANGTTQTIQSPAYGTSGSPSADVSSVQGVSGGVAITVIPQPLAVTDRSGTAGTAASVLCAANENRRGLLIQNLSTANIYFNVTGTATAGAGSMIPNAYWESANGSAGTGAVSVIGVVAAQAYTAKEW